MLSNTTFVIVTSNRRIEQATHSVIYDFTITDTGMAAVGEPGELFSITSLIITPQESSFECMYKENAVFKMN